MIGALVVFCSLPISGEARPAAGSQFSSDIKVLGEFTDDPVAPGGTVTLEYSISNSTAQNATAISFNGDLDAGLSGLAAVGLPANDVCGSGSQISGTSVLSFMNGSLGPSGSCSFTVTVQVPASAPNGTFSVFTADPVSAQVGGAAASTAGSNDSLVVASSVPAVESVVLVALAVLLALLSLRYLRRARVPGA